MPDNPGYDVEEKPDAAKDNRLHRVEADKLVVFFEDVKDEPAEERDTGEGRGDVGRKSRGSRRRGGARSRIRSWMRRRIDWIWHASLRGTPDRFVKATWESPGAFLFLRTHVAGTFRAS